MKEIISPVNQKYRRNLERVKIIPHRGGGKEMPWCTIEGISEMVANGTADILDLDIRLSKDGVPVVHYGEDLSITTNKSGKVRDMTLSELQELDAGFRFTNDGGNNYPYRDKGLKIPSLEDLLKEFPDREFVIHMHIDLVPQTQQATIQVIKKVKAAERTIIAGVRRKDYALVSQQTGARRGADWIETVKFLTKAELARRIKILNLKSVAFDIFMPGGESGTNFKMGDLLGQARIKLFQKKHLVDTCHSLGKEFWIWTVNENDEMVQWINLGVDAIWTDYPSKLKQLKEV
jgi:glycerophosphoryl diester phosphodiesterase